MHNAIFCAGFVTGMVLALVILNLGRMTQQSPPHQAMVPISGASPVAREPRSSPPSVLCLTSNVRCMDVDGPPPQICLVSTGRCAATGKVELLMTTIFSGNYPGTELRSSMPSAGESEYLASVQFP
jgi:hypothetical protein